MVSMVARITRAGDVAARADGLRTELLAAEERDAIAYGGVIAAQGLPKADDAQRQVRARALQLALAGAAEEPLRAASLCLAVLQLAREAAGAAGPSLASDAGCAAEFAAAALAACAYNVRVNHRYMKDAALVARGEAELAACESEVPALLAEIRAQANRPARP